MFKRNLASTRRRKAGREKKLVPAKSFNSGKLGQEKGTGSGKWIEDPLQLRFRLPRANAAASKAGAPLKILPAGEKGLRLLSLPRDRALSRGESRFIDLSLERETSEDDVSVLFAERIDVIAYTNKEKKGESNLESRLEGARGKFTFPLPPRCVKFDKRVGGRFTR